MISSYNVSLYGLVFWLRKWFLASWRNMLRASGGRGFAPKPHRGSAPGPRWKTSVPRTPCLCPFQTKVLDPPLVVHGRRTTTTTCVRRLVLKHDDSRPVTGTVTQGKVLPELQRLNNELLHSVRVFRSCKKTDLCRERNAQKWIICFLNSSSRPRTRPDPVISNYLLDSPSLMTSSEL